MFLRCSFGVPSVSHMRIPLLGSGFLRCSFGVSSVFLQCFGVPSVFLRCSFGVSSELQNEIFLASLIICLMNRRLVVYLLELVPIRTF